MKFDRETMTTLLGSFSALTGLGFVASAIVQQFAFWMWGLSFTSIASLEDVATGGIDFLLRGLGVLIIITFIQVSTTVVRSRYGRRWALWAIGLLFVAVTTAADKKLIPEDAVRGVIFTVLGIATLIVVRRSKRPTLEVVKTAMDDEGRALWIALTITFTAVVSFQGLTDRSVGTIKVKSEKYNPCGPHRSSKVEARWIGSRAMVLRCYRGDKVDNRVWFYSGEPFVVEPRPPQP